jgi:hypothetical protein
LTGCDGNVCARDKGAVANSSERTANSVEKQRSRRPALD